MLFNRNFKITSDDLDQIVFGTAVLASGGGGDPYIGSLILRKAMKEHGDPYLLDPSRVSDNALVVTVGAVGAATVFKERMPNLNALARAVAILQRIVGHKVDALVAAEAGGMNALLPIALGLRLNIPVIDADGMGRAFPEGQMMTYGIYGGRASPIVTVDDHGNLAVTDSEDNHEAEKLSRSVATEMGNGAMAACYPMKGKFFKSACVRNTISLAQELGAAALDARRWKGDSNEAMIAYLANREKDPRYAKTLFAGKIADVRHDVSGAFLRGEVKLESNDGKHHCEIEFRNENLIAHIDGKAAALVPDIITVMDADRQAPITTENLRFGQRVTVFAMEAPPILRTPQALAVVGPRAFGYDYEYKPISYLLKLAAA